MRGLRIALAGILFAVSIGILVWAWDTVPDAPPATVSVWVDGPDGIAIYNGTLEVDEATALRALEAASASAGFPILVQQMAGLDRCDAWVTAIAGHAEDDRGGWHYHVWTDVDVQGRRDGERDWLFPLQSAECQVLDDGDIVRWTWVEDAAV